MIHADVHIDWRAAVVDLDDVISDQAHVARSTLLAAEAIAAFD